jgi:branched-chain amino acid transport system substrate-binding protein
LRARKSGLLPFDTAGKPDQAVVGLRKLAEDYQGAWRSSVRSARANAGSHSRRPNAPVCATMSMASSAPKLAEPFTYAFRNTSDEGYLFSRVMRTLQEHKLADHDRCACLRHRRRGVEDDGRDRVCQTL